MSPVCELLENLNFWSRLAISPCNPKITGDCVRSDRRTDRSLTAGRPCRSGARASRPPTAHKSHLEHRHRSKHRHQKAARCSGALKS